MLKTATSVPATSTVTHAPGGNAPCGTASIQSDIEMALVAEGLLEQAELQLRFLGQPVRVPCRLPDEFDARFGDAGYLVETLLDGVRERGGHRAAGCRQRHPDVDPAARGDV